MSRRLKPYDIEGVEVVDAASDGRAVIRHNDRVVFVEQGIPGDVLDVFVYRKRKKNLIGRINNIVSPSPHRVEAKCQHFGICGGCKWQMMSYDAQLVYKQKQVTDAFERIAKVEVEKESPILGAESPYFYRNKLEFSFSTRPWLTQEQIASGEVFENPALGFHVPGVFDKIVDIETCYLQKPIVNDIRNALRERAIAEGIPFYGIKEHTGFLREIMFRTSEATGELMVMLIVADDDLKQVERLFKPLSEQFPEVSSWIWMHNPKLNNSFSDLPYQVWKGPAYITEQLGGFNFMISPTSFFQTNPKQADQLYGVVRRMLQEVLPEGQEKHNCVYDLYAGTGSIGIYVSELAEKIVGIEYVESSINDAWKNVKLNNLDHFSFYAGDMKKILSDELIGKEGKADVVICDPPRAGMDAAVVEKLLETAPAHIIYVSCKPSTQARDIALMKDAYEVVEIQAVDMFPHTAHVENVALLKRKNEG
jgi:23S rRNA (uracil1939-C5)-methyltransferase